MNKRVLILGGGITGLTAGWRLAESGMDVEVVEAKPEVGGLAATVKKGNYYLDYGPHFFVSEKQDIIEKVTGLFKEDMPSFRRKAKLFFHGKFLSYPLNIKNIISDMSIADSILIASSFLYRKIFNSITNLYRKQNPGFNFEVWGKNNFGDYLYKLFFKPYTEQFWGMSCKKLSPDSMPSHTRLSFFKILNFLLKRKIIRDDPSLIERESILVMHYPNKGIGTIPSSIANKIEEYGGKVWRGWNIVEIRKNKDGTFIVSASKDGKRKDFKGDIIVSTIPINEMVRMLRPTPHRDIIESSKKLKFLSFVVLFIVIDKKNIFDSLYIHFLGRPYNRIAEFSKFGIGVCPPNENIVTLEFSCHKGSDIWKFNKEQIFEMCIKYLENDNIIKRSDVKKIFVLKTPNAYPIYFLDYKPHLNKILDYINSIENLKVVGRSGEYMYMDMDQCMVKGLNLADEIIRE